MFFYHFKKIHPLSILCIILLLFCVAPLCFIQGDESITITTYYPSPYGVYDEMRVNRMSVGSSYNSTSQPLSNGQVFVEEYVGIGLTPSFLGISPSPRLNIKSKAPSVSGVPVVGIRASDDQTEMVTIDEKSSGYDTLFKLGELVGPSNEGIVQFDTVNAGKSWIYPGVYPGGNVTGSLGINTYDPQANLHVVGTTQGVMGGCFFKKAKFDNTNTCGGSGNSYCRELSCPEDYYAPSAGLHCKDDAINADDLYPYCGENNDEWQGSSYPKTCDIENVRTWRGDCEEVGSPEGDAFMHVLCCKK